MRRLGLVSSGFFRHGCSLPILGKVLFWGVQNHSQQVTERTPDQCRSHSTNAGSDDALLSLHLSSTSSATTVMLRDNAYGNPAQSKQIATGSSETLRIPMHDSHRWYDFSLSINDAMNFERRFAGRIENGTWGFSDPLIGSR